MIGIFKDVKDLTKIKDIQTDCLTSRLFYKGAAAVHFCFLLLLGAKQYFGDPIECDTKQNDAVDKQLIENYCWISATWTVKELYDPKTPKAKMTHPGVGVEYTGLDYTYIYHRYYQWIPTVLTIYIGLFYMPRYIWKCAEGGYLRATFDGLKKLTLGDKGFEDSDDALLKIEANVNSKVERMLKFFRPNKHSNWKYFKWFFFTNYVLNGVVLGIVWFTTQCLLNHHFLTYGSELIRYLTRDDFETNPYIINPMDFVFPKMTKCEYRRVGFSGSNETHAALCVVLLNILNEKIFFALWILYVLLSIIICVSSATRVIFYLVRPFRVQWIKDICKVSHKTAEMLDEDLGYGDLFMLEQLSNISYSYIFHQFIAAYVTKLRYKRGLEETFDAEEEFEQYRQPWMRQAIIKYALKLVRKEQEKFRYVEENDNDCENPPRIRKAMLNKAEYKLQQFEQ